MCSLATEPKLPLAMTSAMARTRSDILPSRSPKLSDCIGCELNHLALLVERHRDRAEAAEHALAAEFLVEHIQMPHAVEQRNDRGLRSDRRRKRLDGVVEVERLAAQQHDVEFFVELVGLHGRRIFQRHVAVRALDHEAGVGQFSGAPRPHQKGHVAAGLQASCRRNIRRWRRRRPRECASLTPVFALLSALFVMPGERVARLRRCEHSRHGSDWRKPGHDEPSTVYHFSPNGRISSSKVQALRGCW